VQDINRRVNVVGDGINVAQRIMNFSEQNQIFVSRAYYDVVSRISERASGQFIHIGERQDKHMRSHDLYAVIDLRATLGEPSLPVSNSSNSASTVRNESIPEDTIMEIEAELANAIGPLAKILIKKTIAGASSAEHLRDLLSVSIPDAAVRATFVLGRSASQVYSPTSRTIRTSRLSSASTESRPMQASPARESHNEFTRPASFVSSDAKVELLSAEQRMLIERALGQYIGPLSKTLVRKEIARQPTFADLLQALAQHIDVPEERTIFLNAAQLIVRK